MKALFLVCCLLVFSMSAAAQSRTGYRIDMSRLPSMQFITQILRPCGSGTTPFVSAIAAADGDLDLTTCTGRNVTINGVPLVVSPGGGLGDPGLNGIVIRTALNTTTARTLTAGTGITVTNGSGTTGNPTVTLANTAVTPGSYTCMGATVDAQGRLTAASTGACGGGGGITGSGTANTVAKFTGPTAVGDSAIVDNGTSIVATSPDIQLNAGNGSVNIGDVAGAFNNALIAVDNASDSASLSTSGAGVSLISNGISVAGVVLYPVFTNTTQLGDATHGYKQLFIDSGTSGAVTLKGATSGSSIIGTDTLGQTVIHNTTALTPSTNAQADLGTAALAFKQVFLDATITAGGTTGAQVINKSAGSVNFAAAATSLVVTSNKVTTSSIVICTVGTNDATLKSVQCVAASGSFTMFANAAATAETRVNFWILNQ